MKHIGNRLRELRLKNDMSQEYVAKMLGVSVQAVSKWENDLTSPDIDTLLKLADIFNISTDELLGKNKIEPVYLPTEQRKDINQLVFRIIVDSVDGDRVRINLPMAAVKIFVNNDSVKVFSGNKALENIDFNQIFALVEQGVIGELVSVDSADGDHVRILVESI